MISTDFCSAERGPVGSRGGDGECDVDGLGEVRVGGGAVVVEGAVVLDLGDEVGEGVRARNEVLVVVGSVDEVRCQAFVVSVVGAPSTATESGAAKPRRLTVGGGVDRRRYSLSGT